MKGTRPFIFVKGTHPFIFVKGRFPFDAVRRAGTAVRQLRGSVQPAFR